MRYVVLPLALLLALAPAPRADEPPKKPAAVILKAQRGGDGDDRGGWRYHLAAIDSPNSDMSVTGWQLMALRAAKNLGCDVPAENIDRAVEYIKRSQDKNGGGFAYFP